MKKLVLAAAVTLAATTALAGNNGVSFEIEREKDTNSHVYENTVKVAPFIKFNNGVKADLQFGASREDVTGANLENSIEARVQKMWEVVPSFKLGARLGIGEKFKSQGEDFSYFTIEPKAQIGLTNNLSLKASMRYRNAFNSDHNYQTRTWKAGFGYDVTKNDEIEIKYFQKRGDSSTNGMLLEYTHSF